MVIKAEAMNIQQPLYHCFSCQEWLQTIQIHAHPLPLSVFWFFLDTHYPQVEMKCLLCKQNFILNSNNVGPEVTSFVAGEVDVFVDLSFRAFAPAGKLVFVLLCGTLL